MSQVDAEDQGRLPSSFVPPKSCAVTSAIALLAVEWRNRSSALLTSPVQPRPHNQFVDLFRIDLPAQPFRHEIPRPFTYSTLCQLDLGLDRSKPGRCQPAGLEHIPDVLVVDDLFKDRGEGELVVPGEGGSEAEDSGIGSGRVELSLEDRGGPV
jgi:hypothetical protein